MGGLPCFRKIFYKVQGHLMSLRVLIDFSGFRFFSTVFMTECVQNRLRENNWNRRSYLVLRDSSFFMRLSFFGVLRRLVYAGMKDLIEFLGFPPI